MPTDNKYTNIPPKVLSCPFCGRRPEVIPYPNGRGAHVECTNPDCEAWGHKFDSYGWNKRKSNILKNIRNYLFQVIVQYKNGAFQPFDVYRCKCCKAEAKSWNNIKHSKHCSVRDFINASR